MKEKCMWASSAAPFVLTPKALLQLSDGSQGPLGKVLFRQALPKGEGLAALGGVPTEEGEVFVVTQAGLLFAINPSTKAMRSIALVGSPLGSVSSLAFVPDLTNKTIGQLWATIPSQNKLLGLTLTARGEQLQAEISQEVAGLVEPVVVRHAQGVDQLWVLGRGTSQITVLDRTGARVRALQLPVAAWSALAITESSTQVEQVYLTRQQGEIAQVWQMPVTPLVWGALTQVGSAFTLTFNRPVSLARLTNGTVQLKRPLTGERLPIGLQLVAPNVVKVLVTGAPTGGALLEVTAGLTDNFGNAALPQTRAVQLASANATADPTPVNSAEAPSNSVAVGGDLDAPTPSLAPLPTTLEPLTGVSLSTQSLPGLPLVHQYFFTQPMTRGVRNAITMARPSEKPYGYR